MDFLRAKWLVWVLVLLGLALWVLAVWITTPTRLTLLSGPEGSTSHQDALRYQSLLTRRGLDVVVEPTDGAVENLERLARQGGELASFSELSLETVIGEPELVDRLYSLGSLYLQPIWIFGRTELVGREFRDLEGRKLILGATGSATRVLAERLLEINGVTDRIETVGYDDLSGAELAGALAEGRVDAMFALGEPGAPEIRTLLEQPGLEPHSFHRVEAYDRRYQMLVAVRLPEGTLDLAHNLPPRDLDLLAVPVQLVVPRDLHPSIADLLLEASSAVHREATLLSERDAFPKPAPVSIPLSPDAQRYFDEGPLALHGHLPFWLAGWLHRTTVVLVALFGATVALAQILPMLLALAFTRPMHRLYAQLEAIERSLTTGDVDRAAALEQLDRIERESAELELPLGTLRAPFFELRQNLHDLRGRLLERADLPEDAPQD